MAAALSAAALVPILSTTPAVAAGSHVDNPYVGATQFVNPDWAAQVNALADSTSDSGLAAAMHTVAGKSTAVWMDQIAAITGTADHAGLAEYLDDALAQQQSGTPEVIQVVVYDLPGRDCNALASNGELPATSAGLATYKSDYIDPLTAILADSKYASLRISTVVEPDSLPNIVTNASNPACQTAAPFYEQGISYALDKLHAISNVYTYLDTGHSGWLGWDTNSGPAAQEFAKVAGTTAAGTASVDGFITDTANYTPVVEPYEDADQSIGGQPLKSGKFYQYNPDIDESHFAANMYSKLVAAGFPSSIGMVIDTSRDGWGGSDRPAGASTSTDLDTYIAQSKIDRRGHRGLWCNQAGAGLGQFPTATPSGYPDAHLDAFVWIKPPGESDGTSAPTNGSGGKKSDPMCDPSYTTSYGVKSGALADSPLSGQWFPAQFTQLVQNAYPPIS